MNKSFYNDAVSHYLILRCSPDSLKGYQYRMLAANRIEGILSCSLRTIDGEVCLYYDVTGRESLEKRIGADGISGKEIKLFLYSMASVLRALADFLLDEKNLLLNPEYIFYDFEEDRYCFTYYPEAPKENSIKTLFEYLADHVSTSNPVESAVVYHLCDLSGRSGFVLNEKLLDHEYEMAGGENFNEGGNNLKSSLLNEDIVSDYERSNSPDRRISFHMDKDSFSGYRDGEDGDDGLEWEETDEFSAKGSDSEKKMNPAKKRTPGKILALAIVFLVMAVGLEICRFFVVMTDEQKIAVHSGMIASLGMALLTALYGTLFTWKKNRSDKKEQQIRADEQKKNAMKPTVEYEQCDMISKSRWLSRERNGDIHERR